MIRLTCPQCKTALRFKPEVAGRTASCPQCQTRFPVPKVAPAEPASGGGGGLIVVLALLVVAAGAGGGYYFWQMQPFAAPPPTVIAVAPVPVETNAPVAPKEEEAPPVAIAPAQPEVKAEPPAKEEKKPEPTPRPREVVDKPEPPPAPAAGGERRAFLVGVAQYGSADLDDLSFTESDVEDLATVLRDGGYPAGNVVLLTRKQGGAGPTAQRIRTELDAFLSRCGKDDVVLVAFAGHGIETRQTKQFYFCPAGAKLDDETTLISLNEVYRKLEGCRAAYKLLLADACRKDPGQRAVATRPKVDVASVTRPQDVAPPGGVMAFYSCSAGESAWETPELQHGVFFHFLIEGLKGKADWNNDGKVTRPELEHFVHSEVDNYVLRRLRKTQRPYLRGESNDLRALVSRAAPKVAAPDQPDEPPAKPADPSILLAEDFRKVKAGALPAGWSSQTCRAVKDKEGRACLESAASEGMQQIYLPPLKIQGDFFIECEVHLQVGHEFHLRLEGAGSAVPVEVSGEGEVTLPETRPQHARGFKAWHVNRIRLVREGDIYRISLNDADPVSGRLDNRGPFHGLRLDVSAGARFGQTARLYVVKVGVLAVLDDSAAPPPAGTLLLAEDFRTVPQGDLPKGWRGETFHAIKDEGGRTCLESRSTQGAQSIVPPPLAIHGDFVIGVELLLQDGHNLRLRLERLGIGVPIELDGAGTVTMPDTRPQRAPGFKVWRVNRLRVQREGGTYRVFVNDVPALSGPLPYTGPFDVLRLELSAGERFAKTAKIYAVQAALLGESKAPPPGGVVLVDEDFTRVPLGELPAGWASPSLGKVKAHGRSSLESRAKEGMQAVVPAPLALAGDFYVESEVFLVSGHEFVLRLVGSGVNLPIKFDSQGTVTLPEGRPQRSEGAHAGINRFQVVRQGPIYRILVNDVVAMSLPMPYRGSFAGVSLEISAGERFGSTAKIHSLRAGLPQTTAAVVAAPAAPPGAPALKALHEDFLKIDAGKLPDGWSAALGGIAVVKSGQRRALELTGAAPGSDMVVLPKLELKGKFVVECEFDLPERDSYMIIQLQGEPDRRLQIRISGDKNVVLQENPALKGSAVKMWSAKGATNRVRLERTEEAYVVRLNDQFVGGAPASLVTGDFTRLRLGLGLTAKGGRSPRIYSIRAAAP